MTGNYKHIVEHVYFVDNNILYRDYTLYFIAAREYTHHSPGKIVLEGALMYGDNFLQWFLPKKQVAPPKGSSVYLFPGCPYAVNDIRANYTIKRKIDTADYNVVSKDHVSSYGCFLDRDIYAVFPSQKIIVAGEKIADNALYAYANALVDGKAPLDESEMLIIRCNKWFCDAIIDEPALSLINGTLKKPCVSVELLDRNVGQALTIDVLDLLLRTGSQAHSKEDVEKFILQVNVMNQHDWRKCPATVALLKRILMSKCRYTCYNEVASTPSRYSKQVREFLNLDDTAPATPEDYALGQAFLDRTLGIGDVRIASMGNVLEKLRINGIPEVKFEQFYDCAVRIKKKEYAAS